MTAKDDSRTAAIMLLVMHPIGGRNASVDEIAHALGVIARTEAFAELGVAFHAAMMHNLAARVRVLQSAIEGAASHTVN